MNRIRIQSLLLLPFFLMAGLLLFSAAPAPSALAQQTALAHPGLDLRVDSVPQAEIETRDSVDLLPSAPNLLRTVLTLPLPPTHTPVSDFIPFKSLSYFHLSRPPPARLPG